MRVILDISHRFILVSVFVIAIIASIIISVAYNSGQPATVVGHSPEELVVNGSSIVDGSIGSADLGDNAVNSSKIDTTQIQRRVSGSCGSGSSIRVISEDGTVTCETDDTGSSGFSTKGIQTSSTSVSANNFGSVTVCCPGSPGTISGGGCDLDGIGQGGSGIIESLPYSGCASSNGWACRAYNADSGSRTLTVYAICLG